MTSDTASDDQVPDYRQLHDWLIPILDAINDAVVFVSRGREFLMVNRRALEFLGLADSETFSQWSYDERRAYCQGHLDNPHVLEALLPVMDDDFTAEASGEIKLNGSAPRTLFWSYGPVFGADGTLLGRLHVATDVTEERQAQQNLHDLIGVLGCEFRSALMPVVNLLPSILEDDENRLSEKTRAHLRYIYSSLEWMDRIFRSILVLAQTARGELRLLPGPVAVGETLNAVMATLRPQLEGRSQEVSIHLPDDLPPFYADHDRFQRMLSMLMLDAITSSDHAAVIEIEAFETSSPSSLGTSVPLYDGMAWGIVRITLLDSGEPPGPQRRPDAGRNMYGDELHVDVGLGVSTADAFARLHGGGVWVDDQPGKNRSFLLGLPLAGARRHISTSERKAPLILLAIPSAHRFRDLQKYLRGAGYEVITRGTVAGASRTIQAHRPALILATGNLPAGGKMSLDEFVQEAEHDGITVLRVAIMRHSDGSLLFSLSPNATLGQDVAQMFAHFNITIFLRLLSQALNHITARILVVDDHDHLSPDDLSMLRRRYHSVWAAQSTDQAIEMARALLPNLIVTAIDHPGIDTNAMLNDLRDDPRTDWIPVMGLSRLLPPVWPPDLLEVVTHPLDADKLLSAIDRSLGSYPSAPEGEESASPPPD
jgi:CheY-like chemotaxis protein